MCNVYNFRFVINQIEFYVPTATNKYGSKHILK